MDFTTSRGAAAATETRADRFVATRLRDYPAGLIKSDLDTAAPRLLVRVRAPLPIGLGVENAEESRRAAPTIMTA